MFLFSIIWCSLSSSFTNSMILIIIYLSRKSARWIKPIRTGEVLTNSRPLLVRCQDGYFLWVYVRRATMNSPVFMMIINSSYVLISTTPFRKARNGWLGRLPASLISILYSYFTIFVSKLLNFPFFSCFKIIKWPFFYLYKLSNFDYNILSKTTGTDRWGLSVPGTND